METDVIVVGGGAAGCYAALSLHERGVKVLQICKGLIGKSGASIFAGNLAVSGRLLGNSEEEARNTFDFLVRHHNQFLIDQHWAKRCGEWIETTYYRELEEAGLYFRRDDQGNVVTSPGKVRSIAANVQGNSGVPFMDLRRKQIIRAGIPRLEECLATALLQRPDGSVGGVFALDFLTGEYVAALGRCVLVATGYSDRLYTRSTGTREMSGDGLAFAWRAGATLVNLEMQWWHTNDVAHPPSWQRMQIYPNPILGSEKSARMVNAAGEEFFNQQVDAPMAFGPYTVQLKALIKQVRAAKAGYAGGYFAGFDHIDAEELDAYTTYGKPFRQLGLSPQDTLLEVGVTAHYRQGGIDVDTTTMRSSLAGLYAAGGLAGHSNGLIALATYDGKVAADGICADLPGLSRCPLPERQVQVEAARLDALLNSAAPGGMPPVKVKEVICALMSDKAGVEKDESGLSSALGELRRIRSELHSLMSLRNRTRVANSEWVDAMDVANMLDACELILLSSLERRESRGPFVRRDYPMTDNECWLAANVLSKGADGPKFQRRPYQLPFIRPDFIRKDNLEVAW